MTARHYLFISPSENNINRIFLVFALCQVGVFSLCRAAYIYYIFILIQVCLLGSSRNNKMKNSMAALLVGLAHKKYRVM